MKAAIGMMGLGVMGSNLALNIERNGFPVAVWNRSPGEVDLFLQTEARGLKITAEHDVRGFAAEIERPRRIIMLVKAGEPVDWTIAQIKPHLEPGDVLIDGGNSHFTDTRRREEELRKDGIEFIGCGVSGGAEGARLGPSLMPGGSSAAYDRLRPVFESIAAKVDGRPCVTHVGPDGAGHFVKMVHNGIEYGDMQLIAEAYDFMRRVLAMRPDEIADVFAEWNEGDLGSFLVEITTRILKVRDRETGLPLIDLVLDKAGQKGTGKWTAEIAGDLGVPIPTIDAALGARLVSALKEERVTASRALKGLNIGSGARQREASIVALRDALHASRLCCYAQGFALIAEGSHRYQWNITLSEIARIWKGGCIIRARLLDVVKAAYERNPALKNLLLDSEAAEPLVARQPGWRNAVVAAIESGVPVPSLSASLAYFDGYRAADLPQNLTQAQRDYFGSHTYERKDKLELGSVHTDWSTE